MEFHNLTSKLSILFLSLALSIPSLAASLAETQRAANLGVAEAQNNLGRMYDYGEGVRRIIMKQENGTQKQPIKGMQKRNIT